MNVINLKSIADTCEIAFFPRRLNVSFSHLLSLAYSYTLLVRGKKEEKQTSTERKSGVMFAVQAR